MAILIYIGQDLWPLLSKLIQNKLFVGKWDAKQTHFFETEIRHCPIAT